MLEDAILMYFLMEIIDLLELLDRTMRGMENEGLLPRLTTQLLLRLPFLRRSMRSACCAV